MVNVCLFWETSPLTFSNSQQKTIVNTGCKIRLLLLILKILDALCSIVIFYHQTILKNIKRRKKPKRKKQPAGNNVPCWLLIYSAVKALFSELISLPPAKEVCEGYVFKPVRQSFCSQGGVSQHVMGQHYISSCTGVESQLVWRQHTGNIKCMMR